MFDAVKKVTMAADFAKMAIKGGWITLAIAAVALLAVGFIKLAKNAEESRKKMAEIERLKLGGSTDDAQASLKLLNSEYDKQLRTLSEINDRIKNRPKDSQLYKDAVQAKDAQVALVQSLSDTIKLQIRNIDNLELTRRGQETLAEVERKNAAIKADLDAKELEATEDYIDAQGNIVEAVVSTETTIQEAVVSTETVIQEAVVSTETTIQEAVVSTETVIQEAVASTQTSIDIAVKDSVDVWKGANQEKLDNYNQFADSVTTVGKAVFEQLGHDIVDGTVSWNNLATAAVNAIGSIISALGDQMAAKAAAAFIDAIVLGVLGAGSLAAQSAGAGAAYTAAAAAAWIAGSALKAKKFADGGIVQPQPGGVQALVAEAGQAEAIIPLDRLDQMLARAGGSTGEGGMMNLIVNLDSRPLLDKIFEATRNRTVLISQGAVV
jgi:hypothetical protein